MLNIRLFRRLVAAGIVSLLVMVMAACGGSSAPSNGSSVGGSGSSGNSGAPGTLSVSPTSISFGNVAFGTIQTQSGSLSASGGSVTISSVSSNQQDFTVTGISFPVTVAAGSSVPFTVSFTAQTVGSVSGSISFASNASNSPSSQSLTGTGILAAAAFYVATNGNDSNPGTLAQPFATLGMAQQAMQASSSIKTTYIRAGTYQPAVAAGTSNCMNGNSSGASVELGSADDGETWSVYPPDGYNSAVLEGQSTVGTSGSTGGNGTGCAFAGYNISTSASWDCSLPTTCTRLFG